MNVIYQVKTPINKGKKTIDENTKIELDSDEKETQALLNCGAIVSFSSDVVEENPVTPVVQNGNKNKIRPEDEEVAKQTIINAINSFDKGDKTKFTNAGKPDANVLTETLGWEVSAKERDVIWSEIQSNN